MPVTPDDMAGAMTTTEVATALHVDPRTVRRLIAAREIDVVRIGTGRGRPRITRRALTDYLNRRNQQRGATA